MSKKLFITLIFCLLNSLFPFEKLIKKDLRPNIIIIMTDDMGYSDIGCFGGEISTPPPVPEPDPVVNPV